MYNPAIANVVSMGNQISREAFGAQVVSKTLDYMNSSSAGFGGYAYGSSVGLSNNADYNFQTSVLNAAYSGIGNFVNIIS